MKDLTTIIYCIFLPMLSLQAQSKGDFTWVMGYPPNDSAGGFGGTILDFSPGINMRFFNTYTFVGNSAQICNEEGQTVLYTNGCKILNSEHEVISNGDGLNPGQFYDFWCDRYEVDYGSHQGLLALPLPGHPDKYYLFHLALYRLPGPPWTEYLRDFYSTRIDMSANNGLGAVVEKNRLMLQDTNLIDNVTAVRHGNGRDWWVVLPRGASDLIYTFLLTPEGLQGPFEQRIGVSTSVREFSGGQIVFSPDGSKFARVSASPDGIDIFNFDRCSGKFSCPRRLPPPDDPRGALGGVAISPNSRYLYVSATVKMFQYDLWAGDIARSKVLLGEYDNFLSNGQLWTTFYQQRLAPDGKIYMSAPNGVKYLHVVHQPDSAGLACDFRQHDLELPTHNGFCLPNFPYFRLYDAPNSPCDTLGIDAPAAEWQPWLPVDRLILQPNPVSSGQVTVRYSPCSGGRLNVYDLAGRRLLSAIAGQEGEYTIDCSDWPTGMYIVSFMPNGSACRPESAKLVVAR